jgi:predicted ATP-grasp superfamily ATP-dependent carboligase
VQEFLKGEPVSVSLLCTDTQTLSISLNKQNITLATPNGASCYLGGAMPFDHNLKQEAFQAAEQVVSCFSGLKGYVGVDMILTNTGPVVLDVNPRLTTSFVGLCRTLNFNFANAIVNAALKNSLPSETTFSNRYVCFSKIDFPKVDIDLLDIMYGIPSVVSPPFLIEDNEGGCALISAESNSLNEANRLLEENRKNLLNICGA